jgi:phosphosulfolactate synthase
MKTAFPMLQVMELPPKPRKRAMLLMSEVGIPMRESEDIIEIAAPVIEYAKITDHAGPCGRLSAEWVKKKIRLYDEHGIEIVPGGIPFQLAVLQNKVEDCRAGFSYMTGKKHA